MVRFFSLIFPPIWVGNSSCRTRKSSGLKSSQSQFRFRYRAAYKSLWKQPHSGEMFIAPHTTIACGFRNERMARQFAHFGSREIKDCLWSINISCLRHFFRQTHKLHHGLIKIRFSKTQRSIVVTHRDSRCDQTDHWICLSDEEQTRSSPKGLISSGANFRSQILVFTLCLCAKA